MFAEMVQNRAAVPEQNKEGGLQRWMQNKPCSRSRMCLFPTAIFNEQTLSTGFADTVHRPWFVFLDLDVLLRPTRITPLNKDDSSGEPIETDSVEIMALTSAYDAAIVSIGVVENDVVDTGLQVVME